MIVTRSGLAPASINRPRKVSLLHRHYGEIRLAISGNEKLGHEVALVGYDLRAQTSQQPAKREKDVRRLAELDDVDGTAKPGCQAEHGSPAERCTILSDVSELAVRLERRRVFKHRHARQLTVADIHRISSRHHRHPVAASKQIVDLLKDPDVDPHRDVFNDHKHMAGTSACR
jgi:hypothetical protein